MWQEKDECVSAISYIWQHLGHTVIRARPPPELRGGSRAIPRPDKIYNLSSAFRVFPGVSSQLNTLDKMSEQMIHSPQELPDILSPDFPLISCQRKTIWYKHEAKNSELISKAVKFKCFAFYFIINKWLGLFNGLPIRKSINVIKMKDMVSLVSREDQTQMWCHGNRTNSGLLKGLIQNPVQTNPRSTSKHWHTNLSTHTNTHSFKVTTGWHRPTKNVTAQLQLCRKEKQ